MAQRGNRGRLNSSRARSISGSRSSSFSPRPSIHSKGSLS